MPRHVRDDFESKSGYWRWRVDNYARFEVGGSILRMCMGPTEALYYSNAEIADGVFDDLPWASAEMSIRVRFSSQHFGSAGFGFWNHSMRIDMSFPVWFIYLRAYGSYPLQGFFIQAGNRFQPVSLFRGVKLYRALLTLLPFAAPIRIDSSKPLAQDLDLTKWHTFGVKVSLGSAEFYIDGSEVYRARLEKNPRLRADVWIDNAVFTPFRGDAGKVFRHVTQENRSESCLEVDWIEIREL